MIKTAAALHRRTVEASREAIPEYFEPYPHLDSLKVGWYPSQAYFREDCTETFWKAMPDTTGAVFPFYYGFDAQDLSHLLVASFRDDGTLDPRRRVVLPAKGQRPSRVSGIFGIQRLREAMPTVVVSDDELLACRYGGVVSISAYSPKIGQLLRRCAPVVNLRSASPRWVESMFALSKHGLQLTVDDQPLVDYVSDLIVRMYHDKLGLSVVTHRVTELITPLVPLERLYVLQKIKAATSVDFEHVLPDDFQFYRREGDFYRAMRAVLDEKIESVKLYPGHLELKLPDGCKVQSLLHPLDIQAAICQLFEVETDLVEWVYRDIKNIPRFYLYRGTEILPRSDVSAKLIEVATTLLMRKARP